MSNEVIAAVRQRFPHFILRNTWGMTEVCGAATTCAPQYQGFEHAHTVGKALGGMSVKVIDPASGDEVSQPGEAGEILVKGPTVTMGYLANERATRETFEPDGWLHTGDLGFVDNDGFVIIQVLYPSQISPRS
jgi:long-subunit acyl-CoA synthetase (AMP-forming)